MVGVGDDGIGTVCAVCCAFVRWSAARFNVAAGAFLSAVYCHLGGVDTDRFG